MSKSTPASHEASKSPQGDLLATTTTAVVPTDGLLAKFQTQLAALDQFAESNSLALLSEDKGAFTAALAVADAIVKLEAMLTDEIMEPIMKLQGTRLGFKTDKDKPTDGSKPGYPVAVVRRVFIEAVLKGFKMVGNQVNIIADNFYATKEGFEEFFLRMGKLGKFTDYRESYSVPKLINDQEAIVTVSASWIWDKKADKLENIPISIRVNKGQGADAILGKAKRKIIARIYSRVTGTVITDGDVSEAGPIIDVTARNVADAGAGAGTNPAPGAPAMPTDEQKAKVKEILGEHTEKANEWLRANSAIRKDGTFLDVTAKTAANIIGNPKGFLKAIGATAE